MIEMFRTFVLALAATCTLVTACAGVRHNDPKADLVLRRGAIYTLDAGQEWAESIAIRTGEISYVGPDAGVERFIGPETRVVDLRGAMVVPGFQDVHIHAVASGINRLSLNLDELRSAEEYLGAIAEYAEHRTELEWILGGGWHLNGFQGVNPSRQALDAVVADRPVALGDSDGHSLWVNSKALELAGITRDTPDPENGRIDRDPQTGEPIGSLQESAMQLVLEHAPTPTPEQTQRAAQHAISILNGFGITSFQEAIVKVSGHDAFQNLDAFRALSQRGELNARVVASLWWEAAEGEKQIARLQRARSDYSGGLLRASTVKIMQDGVIENHTASLLEPYIGEASGRGKSNLGPESLTRAVTRLDEEGFQVHFHAIGDAAIRECLDAVDAAIATNPSRDRRHHISHLQLIDPADIPRFHALGVVANFQPLWAYADPSILDLTIPVLGPERSRWLYPIGSVLRSGAKVAFGSDWYVSSPNPLEEIEVAITRKDPWGDGEEEAWIPEERIGLHDALAAFTLNAAYVNSHDDRTGSIEVGKFADLAVLDRNLFEIAPSEISDTRVIVTLLAGDTVHGDLAVLQSARIATADRRRVD